MCMDHGGIISLFEVAGVIGGTSADPLGLGPSNTMRWMCAVFIIYILKEILSWAYLPGFP